MSSSKSLEASLAKLRHLFTAAERRVLESSMGKALAGASEAEVKAVLKQARGLRDKWRDLVGGQVRKTKRGGGTVGPYAVKAPAPANQRSKDKTDLLTATVAHIETRLAALTGPRSTAGTAAAPVAVRKKKAAVRSAAATRGAAPSVSKKARQAATLKSLESARVQGLKTSASTQRKATTALKAERLKLKGVTTRRAGHVKGRVGRAQAKRDGRNAAR